MNVSGRNRLLYLAAVTILPASALLAIFNGCSSGTTAATGSTGSTGITGTTGNNGTTWTGGGDGVWRRDANSSAGEAATFDPCNAHQPGSGEYHYHENPICLRYQLGDNIVGTNVGTATATYTESTATKTHSPILGWAFDGYPIYGPYGYSTATSATSGVRRMVSSYALRTDNTTTRTSLPAWAQAYQGITTLTSSQYGPAVSSTYFLGRYVEDYNYTAGSGDLDQYNGRYCVTPDFPNGTYAYFVTIDASGNAAFPYYLGPQFNGTVSGGSITTVPTSSTYYTNHAYSGGTSTWPQLTSWFLKNTSMYAQIYYVNGTTVTGPTTTWTGNTTATYADIQTIQYDSTATSTSGYLYLKISGLASHMMGPWWNSSAHTSAFPNLPTNQNGYSKIPIINTNTNAAPTTKTATGGGSQGRWVNGVGMFNMLDFASYSNSKGMDVMPTM